MVTFIEVPAALRTPGSFIELDGRHAQQGAPALFYRCLLQGQRLSTGTVAAGVLMRISNKDEAAQYWGAGSQMANMAEAWFACNDFTELWGIGLADPAGTAATGSVAFSGTPTEAGIVQLRVGNRRYPVTVAVGASASSLATALTAAITADTALGATGSASTGTVTLTAKHVGACGNDLDIRHSYVTGEKLPAGLTVTITAMSGGAGSPDVTASWTALGDDWFNVIVSPFTDATNLSALEAELLSRQNAMRAIGGVAIAAAVGNFSTISTLGNTRNAIRHEIYGTNGSPTPPWEFAAAMAAVSAFSLANDPAVPLWTLRVPWIGAPARATRFTQAQRNSLLYSGISTFTCDADGTVRIERAITTYKTNAAGGADTAWLDINTPATNDLLRYETLVFNSQFARSKLAKDGTNFGAGQFVTTPSSYKAAYLGLAQSWEQRGYVEDLEQLKRDLVVEISTQDPTRLEVVSQPNLVNGLLIIAMRIQFIL